MTKVSAITKSRVTVLCATLGIAIGSATPVLARTHEPRVFRMKPLTTAMAPSAGAATSPCIGSNLQYFGGPVLQTANTYAIRWGKKQRSNNIPDDFATALPLFLEGFGGSSYSCTLYQFMPASTMALGSFDTTTVTDKSASPGRSPSTRTIVKEVCKYIKKGRLPLDPIDPVNSSGGVYFVFTTNFPRNLGFCGWHDYGTCQGSSIAVSYVPNTTGVIPGCDPDNSFGANGYSQGTRSILNIVAHELSEAATDPDFTGWWDPNDSCEIGDKCAWQFDATVTLANNSTWEIQDEWSNSASACVQDQVAP
jgi:hypothetical protein